MRHSMKFMRRVLILLLASASSVLAQKYQTTVTPLPGENFAESCRYKITLPAGNHPIRAVWVIFDRGRDIMKFYSDPEVVKFARGHDMAIMMPHQCNGLNAPGGSDEMDMDPAHGVGPALFRALSQLAGQSGHPELSAAKLVLLGFSGTGALFAHFVGFAPDRVIASLLADPGHYDPVGIDNVHLPAVAISVPELIMAGGADKISGTQKPYDYFLFYRLKGAPWSFVVQNKTPHCCIINAKPLILLWLAKIIELRAPSPNTPLKIIDTNSGWSGFIRTCPSEIHDTWGNPTWDVCNASIHPLGEAAPADQIPAGWFPTQGIAQAWLAFITKLEHATTSVP
jgi:hypothetical protein